MEEQIRQEGSGLRRFLEQQTDLQQSLGAPLAEAARQVVLENIQEINCNLLSACASGRTQPEQGSESLSDLIVLISRSLDEHFSAASDSAARVLIVPEEADATSLRQQLQTPNSSTTIIPGRKCDVTLCSLRNRVTIEQAAREMIGGNDLYKELATRLHSRIDVAWQPFTSRVVTSRPSTCDSPSPSSSTPLKTSVIPVAATPVSASPASDSQREPVASGVASHAN